MLAAHITCKSTIGRYFAELSHVVVISLSFDLPQVVVSYLI